MSAHVCGCDPDLKQPSQWRPLIQFYACEIFPDCHFGKTVFPPTPSTSQQGRGWYVLMLPRDRHDTVDLFYTRHERNPKPFWNPREIDAFRFPTPEAATAAMKTIDMGVNAWIMYRVV